MNFKRDLITLELPPEPMSVKQSLRSADSKVRLAVILQATDITSLIYQTWKPQIKNLGVAWQQFVSAGSKSASSWLEWVEGTIEWRTAVQQFVDQLNSTSSSVILVLQMAFPA